MPFWNASNTILTEKVIPLKILAFSPVLPYPVTEYTTMRTSVALSSQLLQKEIPMYCDEGVYIIVRHIQMMRTDEFCNIVPMMGTFHLVKTVLKCIGKYLGGSGADMIWL